MNSTAPPLVFDTNVLWNFAVIGRLDVLETRYGGRARWSDTIAHEVRTATGHEPLLANVSACAWLGEPIELASAKCLTEVATIQRILAAPGDKKTKHLGEAEAIHIIHHELDGIGTFATDDNGAADLAARRGIRVMRTDAILRDCFDYGELRCPEPFELLEAMWNAGRDGVRVPPNHAGIC